MKIQEVIEILEQFNKWRRGDESISICDLPSPKIIGEAIDIAINLLKEIK